MSNPKAQEIWLVRFPFSDLTSTKVRPALIIAVHREELIILGIFSKVSLEILRETWVVVEEDYPSFSDTGLKKRSLIRAEKIATVSTSVFQKKIGTLPDDLFVSVQEALKKALNISN
ncbi:pemK-like family protein [Lyngbya aestuarii BL J]|uniref:PemK-like family protein n=1 Tax=Lyngbya aestuarii BL J TaxID=1348334 RepID=U7QSC3_9CYAN|nr:type II toxin-antitoxin system PemK/MazF family toxin [Lyngbya aestuarii]ERT09995.1 pemK-like family protein [Lyngbya aestuarii BL J]